MCYSHTGQMTSGSKSMVPEAATVLGATCCLKQLG